MTNNHPLLTALVIIAHLAEDKLSYARIWEMETSGSLFNEQLQGAPTVSIMKENLRAKVHLQQRLQERVENAQAGMRQPGRAAAAFGVHPESPGGPRAGGTTLTLEETMQQLEALGNEKVRSRNKRLGAGDDQFGVQMGDLRKVAAKIKRDHALALALWETGNLDARLLATLVLEPTQLSGGELETMVRAATSAWLADWLNAYVVKEHPEKEALRKRWMAAQDARDSWVARAGWSLTAERIGKSPEGLDLAALLDCIEAEMPGAAPETQWTMNNCLAGIGIHFPELRGRAVAIGERLGVLRDYPVSKGCTSPFAPLWIAEMVRRRG